MTHVNFSDFRAHMARHLDKIEADRTELVVTRQGHEPVVLMPLADLEGLRETMHLLGTQANAERLLRSIADADAGKLVERNLSE